MNTRARFEPEDRKLLTINLALHNLLSYAFAEFYLAKFLIAYFSV